MCLDCWCWQLMDVALAQLLVVPLQGSSPEVREAAAEGWVSWCP